MSKSSRRLGAKAIAAIATPSLMFATGAAFAPLAAAQESEAPASEVVAPETPGDTSSEAPAEPPAETPAEETEAPSEETPADTDDNDSDADSSTPDTPAESTPSEDAPAEESEAPSEAPAETPAQPVEINRVPTITTSGPTSYPVGTNFDPIADLKPTANDPEDGDISQNIQVVSNNVNENSPGTYEVEFAVYDSFGNRASRFVTVTITGNGEENQAPSIKVNGPMSYPEGYDFSPIDLSVQATDPEDGDISDSLELLKNTVNPEVPGDYQVVYQATDSGGLTTKIFIPVTITPKKQINETPTITVNGPTTFPVGTPYSFDNLNATAYDPEDGDITDKIEQASSDVNPDEPGTYNVVLAVTDSDGARHETIVTVKYVPKMEKINAAPVIKGPEKVEIDQGADFSDPVEVLKAKAQDQEDGDITDEITVVSNDVDTDTPGNYRVVLKVTDSDGASTTKAVDVHVKPKDEAEDSSVNIFVAAVVNLHVGINFDDPVAVLHATASSAIDGNLTGSIKVVASDVNIEVAGTYHITLSVTASNGTKSEKTVEVVGQDKDDNGAPTKDEQQSDSSNDATAGHATQDKQQPAYRNLANTGASVIGIVVVGLALVGGGILLSRRRKQS
ncbi:immunoglobulin-like domain-containing protein [Corynebacterium pseudopelargi]|nr:immunoglobulin-like domain-containing protein [Corynebacterium pseudopelargi]